MWQWQVSTITFRTSDDGSSFGFLVMVAEVSHGGGLQKAVRACKSARLGLMPKSIAMPRCLASIDPDCFSCTAVPAKYGANVGC